MWLDILIRPELRLDLDLNPLALSIHRLASIACCTLLRETIKAFDLSRRTLIDLLFETCSAHKVTNITST